MNGFSTITVSVTASGVTVALPDPTALTTLSALAGRVLYITAAATTTTDFTLTVNSVGHLFGPQRFDTGDGSRNNFVLGFLAMGDGWHNNHHRAPTSARHGFAWYEFDVSYHAIRSLRLLKLVWDVRWATEEDIARRQKELSMTPEERKEEALRLHREKAREKGLA